MLTLPSGKSSIHFMMFWKISVATFEALGSRSRRETLMGLCRKGKEEREWGSVDMAAARFGEEPPKKLLPE